MSFTDPTGHLIWFLAAAVISVNITTNAVVWGTVLSAVAGYLETGTLKGALYSALSAGAGFGVGGMFGDVGGFLHELARAAMHGLMQGVIAAAQGGQFGAAFFAAAFTSGWGSARMGPTGEGIGARVVRVLEAAVVGGTASRIGGGKFANGAVTGAFVEAFGGNGRNVDSDGESVGEVEVASDLVGDAEIARALRSDEGTQGLIIDEANWEIAEAVRRGQLTMPADVATMPDLVYHHEVGPGGGDAAVHTIPALGAGPDGRRYWGIGGIKDNRIDLYAGSGVSLRTARLIILHEVWGHHSPAALQLALRNNIQGRPINSSRLENMADSTARQLNRGF